MNETLRSGDGWELWLGDSRNAMLHEMSRGAFDAIVTSPPYPDQRTYASGETDPDHERARPTNHSRRRRREAVEAWPEWFEPFLDGMAEVLSPRGSAMVNLGVVVRDGQESDYVDETLRRAKARGWRCLHRIVWHKPNAAPPSWPRLMLIRHEYVLWLARSADAYRGYDDAEPGYDPGARVPYSDYSMERLRHTFTVRNGDERYAKRGGANPIHPDGARPATVQEFPVGARRGLRHPAPMSQGLADRLVRVCCPPGGTVFDPFAGSCTTGLAAMRAGRRFVGMELRPLYFEEGARRMERWDVDPAWSPPPVQADGSDHPSLFEETTP